MTVLCLGSGDRPLSNVHGFGACAECLALVRLNREGGCRRHYTGGKKLKGRGAAKSPRNWNEE